MGTKLVKLDTPGRSLVEGAPVVREDLEALSNGDLWILSERAGALKEVADEILDERLRDWVEVEKKTQKEISQIVGCNQSQVSRRCQRLGLSSGRTNSGERRSMRAHTPAPEGAAHYLPDVVADDADQNLRTQALHWFEQGAIVKQLLDKKKEVAPRSAEDRKAIKREAAVMERTARRLKESL